MNMEFKRKLPAPQTVKDMYPVTEKMARQKQENDRQIQAVITGEDQRLMLLIGPCSADREDAVLEYAARLQALRAENAGASQEKQRHLENQILPGIAAYETLQTVMPKDEALRTVHGYVEKLARNAHKKLVSLLRVPGLYRLVPAFL